MSATDWISAAASVVAAIIAIVTLVTVYIGAIQIISQNRTYRRGLSWRSIGPWQPIVARWTLFGLQRHITVPVVSLKALVDKKWEPNLTFPLGFPVSKTECLEKGTGNVEAHTSWVNFMQALGLSPDNADLYEVQDASELVNGMVPMPWKGKDLAAMCSMLGFQSHQDRPNPKDPVTMPMQWSGPLGWLQFRDGPHGCIAQFRRRMIIDDQISKDLHNDEVMARRQFKCGPNFLISRLWASINGIFVGGDRFLYIGGADRYERPQDAQEEEPEQTAEQMYGQLINEDLTDEEILQRLFGKKDAQPEAVRRQAREGERGRAQNDMDRHEMPDFLDSLHSMVKDKMDSKKKEELRPCPGLHSITVSGELAYSRGLDVGKCHEYDRKFTQADGIDGRRYPYNLGNLYMDSVLLDLVKNAMLLLQPDGFYLSCTHLLFLDIIEIYGHIQAQSNILQEIFPAGFIDALDNTSDELRFAMRLCNDLQRTRKTARAWFTVADMQLISKASSMVRQVLINDSQSGKSLDLAWALLSCRDLVPRILKSLQTADFRSFLQARVTCTAFRLDCSALFLGNEGWHGVVGDGIYDAPCVADGEFSGLQMVAALCMVFITYYWIDAKWITDVGMYDHTMPQSVLMC